jgi:hypothetical protein
MWSFHNACHPVKKLLVQQLYPHVQVVFCEGLEINVDEDSKIISMFCGTCSGMLFCLVSHTCITMSGGLVILQSKQQACKMS